MPGSRASTSRAKGRKRATFGSMLASIGSIHSVFGSKRFFLAGREARASAERKKNESAGSGCRTFFRGAGRSGRRLLSSGHRFPELPNHGRTRNFVGRMVFRPFFRRKLFDDALLFNRNSGWIRRFGIFRHYIPRPCSGDETHSGPYSVSLSRSVDVAALAQAGQLNLPAGIDGALNQLLIELNRHFFHVPKHRDTQVGGSAA